MSNGFQPETVPELSRYIEYQFAGMKENIDSLVARLDRMDVVSREQHKEDMLDIRADLRATQLDLDNYKARQAALWKWLVGSLVFPAISIIIGVLALIS